MIQAIEPQSIDISRLSSVDVPNSASIAFAVGEVAGSSTNASDSSTLRRFSRDVDDEAGFSCDEADVDVSAAREWMKAVIWVTVRSRRRVSVSAHATHAGCS